MGMERILKAATDYRRPVTEEPGEGSDWERNTQTGDYSYDSLPEGTIRLLELRPRVEGEQLQGRFLTTTFDKPADERVKYKAVSYAWGEPIFCEAIQLPGGTLHITTSACGALKRFRSDVEAVVLWIDCICINQRNLLERNAHLAMMDQVYRAAGEVLVWLGEADDTATLAMVAAYSLAAFTDGEEGEAFQRVKCADGISLVQTRMKLAFRQSYLDAPPSGQAQPTNSAKTEESLGDVVDGPIILRCQCCDKSHELPAGSDLQDPAFLESATSAVIKITRRSYFSRLWALLEIALGPIVTYHIGSHYIAHRSLSRIVTAVLYSGDLMLQARLFAALEMVGDGKSSGELGIPEGLGILAMIVVSSLETTLVQDRVYALRALMPPGWKRMLMPNYDLPLGVLQKQITMCATTSDAQPLHVVLLAAFQRTVSQLQDSRSWVMHFDKCRNETCFKGITWHQHIYEAGGSGQTIRPIFDPEDRTLKVQGMPLTRVKTTVADSQYWPRSRPWPDAEEAASKDYCDILLQEHTFAWYVKCLAFVRQTCGDDLDDRLSLKAFLHQGNGRLDHFESWSDFENVITEVIARHDPAIISNRSAEQICRDLCPVFLLTRNPRDGFFAIDPYRILASFDDGRIGWVPENAHVGDEVYLFQGLDVPVILRASGKDAEYEVVGDSYVQGIMNGEAWDAGASERTEEITLI